MKNFDLERALNGAPICTRKGIPATIADVKYDAIIGTRIYVHWEDENGFYRIPYKTDGTSSDSLRGEDDDLFMVGSKEERWVNIYRSEEGVLYLGMKIYTSEKEAAASAEGLSGEYAATAKVTWEE